MRFLPVAFRGRGAQPARSRCATLVGLYGIQVLDRIMRLPPVIALVCLVAGLAVHRVVPLSLGLPSFEMGMGVGGSLLLAAVCVAVAALSELRRHGTTVEPGQRPTALVTSGIFSFTRNPLYLALLLVLLSLAVMVNSLWLVVSAGLLWLALHRVVVRAEERVIEQVFGEEYTAYRRRVRRWV